MPTLTPASSHRLSEVQNPTNSNLLADHHCDRQVWALPPTQGLVESTGQQAADAQTEELVQSSCAGMSELAASSARMNEALLVAKERAFELLDRADELSEELDQFEIDRRFHRSELEETQLEMEALEEEIDEIAVEVESLLQAYVEACASSAAACQELSEEIDLAHEAMDERYEELDRTRQERVEHEVQLLRVGAEIEAAKEQIEVLEARASQKEDAVIRILQALDLAYRQLAALKGDVIEFSYVQAWAENLTELRSKNPYFTIDAVPIEDLRLSANLVPGFGGSEYLASLPTVLSMSIDGQAVESPVLPMDDLAARMKGRLQLSMVGTCPARDPESWGVEQGQNGAAMFATTAVYRYRVQLGFAASAVYDKRELVPPLRRILGLSEDDFAGKAREATRFLSDSDLVDLELDQASLGKMPQCRARRVVHRQVLGDLVSKASRPLVQTSVQKPTSAKGQQALTQLNLGARSICATSMSCSGMSWDFAPWWLAEDSDVLKDPVQHLDLERTALESGLISYVPQAQAAPRPKLEITRPSIDIPALEPHVPEILLPRPKGFNEQ